MLEILLVNYEAQLEAFIPTDINYYKDNMYINFAIYAIKAGSATEAQLAAHSP